MLRTPPGRHCSISCARPAPVNSVLAYGPHAKGDAFVKSKTARTALRLALIATAAASMAACASRPKPTGPVAAAPPPPPPAEQPAPSAGAVGESVLPGSE